MIMFKPSEDGKTHINVYSKGRTILGQMLSNFYVAPFIGPDGRFQTIEGYWYWLSCLDDRLRSTNGWESKQLGRKLRGLDWNPALEFKEKIKAAIKAKIEQHADIQNELSNSSLPFTHYYVYGVKVTEVSEAAWILNHIEELRRFFIRKVALE